MNTELLNLVRTKRKSMSPDIPVEVYNKKKEQFELMKRLTLEYLGSNEGLAAFKQFSEIVENSSISKSNASQVSEFLTYVYVPELFEIAFNSENDESLKFWFDTISHAHLVVSIISTVSQHGTEEMEEIEMQAVQQRLAPLYPEQSELDIYLDAQYTLNNMRKRLMSDRTGMGFAFIDSYARDLSESTGTETNSSRNCIQLGAQFGSDMYKTLYCNGFVKSVL